jgi:type VI secretion system VasD/TssJ family lipoprotein
LDAVGRKNRSVPFSRRRGTAICTVLAALALAGCSWFRGEPPKLFPVDICLDADARLQWHENRAHTLYVRVFPLTVPDGFVSADINDLLADPPPELPGMVGTPQGRTVYPGTNLHLSFDAAEGQAFGHLGVVAGYYDLQGPGKHVVSVEKLRPAEDEDEDEARCYTVRLGPGSIQGWARQPTEKSEDE